MSAQKGSDLLVKIGDGGSPESFTAAVGLRTKSMKFNAESVDISNSDSVNKWRELLAGAGLKSATFTGSGVFKDDTTDETIRAEYVAQTIKNYQIVIPGFGTWEGPFQITDLEYSGDHNKEVASNLTLESAGELAWTAS